MDEIDGVETFKDICANNSLNCAWCGEHIVDFYIEYSDAHLPDRDDTYTCKECGNETAISKIAVTLVVEGIKSRTKEQNLLESERKQCRNRDRVLELRREWARSKKKFSPFCKIFGCTWSICARGLNIDGEVDYNGIDNAMATCSKCDARHDSLKGVIGWVTGCD